jgi:autotransporter-associated beta strand protein
LANAVTVGGAVTLGNATKNGALTLSGTVNLGAAERTLTVASDITASGVISNGSLTKAGAGVLTLTGTSTYTGATTVNAGVLQVGTGGTTGSLATDSAITVGASGTYRLYRGGNTSAVNITNTLAGSGTIELRGTGVTDQSYYVFTGANESFTGNWSIQSGTRGNFGEQSNLGASSATVNVASGGGIWLLSTTSAYTSNLTIAGTGWLEGSGLLTAGAIRFQGATLAGNVTLSADALIAAHGTLVNALSGNIGQTGGARTLEIKNTSATGTSTFNLSGATTLSGGLLVGTPGTGLTVVNLTSTGTMNFAAGSTVALGTSLGIGTLNQTLNIAGAVTNAGTLAVRRVGVLNINSGGTWAQSGDFTVTAIGGYSGQATINAGGSLAYTGVNTIKLEGADAAAGSAILTVNSTGLLTTSAGFERTTVQGAGTGVGSIALTNGGTLKLGANIGQLLVGEAIMTILGGANIHTNGYSTTVSKVISGSGGLTKTGNGTLTFNAANTYTGTTTISGGTLALGGSGSIASTTVNLTNGGALADVTWGAGKTLQIGGAGTLGNGGVGGNFSLSGGTIGFDITDSSSYDSLTVAAGSTFTLTSGVLAFNLTNLQLLAGTYDFINYSGATVVGDWINFNKTGLPSGSRQTTTFSDTGSALRMSVAGSAASMTWSAAVSNIWGIGASKDANWNTNDVVDDATHYYTGDNVTFGDAGAGIVTVDTGGVTAGAVTVNAATDYTFAGASISAVSLAKSGAGTLTLSNALSTTTGTTVSGGTLAFVAGGALSGSLTVNGGAVNLGAQSVTLGAVVLADGSITTGTMTPASLDLRKGTISSIVAGSGNVVKSTADTVVLSGANTYTGTTTINAGTLEFSSASAQTLTGNLLGSGGVFKKSGAGTLTLTPTADSTFAGDVNVTGGTLAIGANFKATGTGALTVGTGATLNSFSIANSATTTIGNSSITLTGATWNLGGTSSSTYTHTYAFSGLSAPISVTNSALNFSSSNATTKAFGAALNFSGSNTVAYASTNYSHYLNLNGAISGTGTLTFNTTGTSTSPGKTITVAAGLTNNFTGAVVLNSSNSSGVMSTLKLSSALGASSYEIKNAYWTLQNNIAGGLDSASSITISAGTLDLTQAWSNSAATLTMTGGTVTVGNAASSIGSLSATAGTIKGAGASSSLTVNQTTSGIFAGVLSTNASNNLTFTKTGAATLTLSGANTTTGLLTVSNGTLNLTGSLASGVSIGAAGTLSVSGSVAGAAQLSAGGRLNGTGSIGGLLTAASGAIIDPGLSGSGTLTVGNLTFTNLGTVNLSQGTTTSMLAVTGTLTASGSANSVTLNIGGGAPELGSYTLIDYSVLAGTGFSAFSLGNLPNRVVANLVNNTANTSIDLNVTGVDLPLWRGAISSEWSTNTLATGSGANWALNSDGVTETDFLVGDTVRFDDTASSTAVEITQANVTPAAAIFDNSTKDYTLSGSYGVAGTGGITKRGSGKLTISNSNSYTGATTVEAGTLSVATVSDSGVAGALGSGSTVVLNGGTLEFTGTTGSTNRAVSLGSSNGTVSVSAANGVLTLSSAAVGAGGLTKTGNGTLVLSETNTYNGGTTVSAGTLQVGMGGATGSLTGAASIASGAKLSLYRSNSSGITVGNVVSGSGTVELRGTGVQNESPYTISGNNASFTGTWSVLSGARLLTASQAVLGAGSVNIASGGGMYLSSAGTYTSNVTIAGSGWNETAGYLGAIRFSGSTLSGGVTLAGNAVIGAHGASTNTLSGAIGETGGARTLEFKNTNTTGTATFNLNGDTNLSGGLQVGIAATGATTVNLGSAGSINLSGGQFRIGNNIGSGAATQTVNVAGAVTNAGSLYVGRPGVLNINNGGSWAQSGAGSVNSQGGYNTTVNVNTGGSFTYTNASTFKLNVGSSGSAALNIVGGTFTTSAGFEQSAAASPGTASVNLSTAGTLKLGADIAEMSSSSNGGVLFTVGTGGGKIDTNGYSGTLSAGITGASGGLTKLGNGTLTLTGTSTYAGATVVSGGTLILAGGENTLADGTITVSSGATLNLASTNAINHASFTSGSILISGGTLTQSAGASGANLTDLYLSNGGTLTTESSAGVSAGGWNYQLNGSVFVIGTSATSINVRDGVALNGSQVFNISDATTSAAADLTVTGSVVNGASAGSLVKTGAGTLALNSANTFTGQLQVNAGTVSVASAASLGGSGTAAVDRIVLNGGTLQATASFATNANHGVTINSAGGTIAVAADTQLTVSAALSGSGAFTKSDTGTLVLAAAGTFSGSTSVSAGTLQLGNVAALGSSIVTLNTGATLNLANFAATNTVFINGGSITNYGQWNGAVGLDAGAFDAQSVNSLAGTSVYVTGSASIDLSGVTKGVVLAGGSFSNLNTYNGNLAVQSALDLSGSDPLGSVELRQGGSLNFGDRASSKAITYKGGSLTGISQYSGSVTMVGTGLNATAGAFGTGALLVGTGSSVVIGSGLTNAINLNGGSLNAAGLSGYQGTLTIGGGSTVNLGKASTFTSVNAANTAIVVANGGVLAGEGTISSLTVGAGGVLAPGNSPGLITVSGTTALNAGGSMNFQILSTEGIFGLAEPGVDYDSVTTDVLDLTNLNSLNRFTLSLMSLSAENTQGSISNFDPLVDYTFDIFTYGTLSLSAGQSVSRLFTIDTTNFVDDVGQRVVAGHFFVQDTGTSIQLFYNSAVPEPSTYGIALGGLALALAAVRRRLKQAKA